MSRKFLTPKDKYTVSRTVKAYEALTVLRTYALNICAHYYLETVKDKEECRNHFFIAGLTCHLQSCEFSISSSFRLCCKGMRTLSLTKGHIRILVADL